MGKSTFLSAGWRKLIMANYVVEPELLTPYVPAGTELDFYRGQCFVSLIGFLFADVRLKGIGIPFHKNFEEINLRFYVRHVSEPGVSQRGVVFVQELVPRMAVTLIANTFYGESYVTRPTRHAWQEDTGELTVRYEWRWDGVWKKVEVRAAAKRGAIAEGSVEEFITEHYWGFTRRGESKSSGYEVAHPRWEVYPVREFVTDVDFAAQYGAEFGGLAGREPESVLLAEGSAVQVLGGGRLAR